MASDRLAKEGFANEGFGEGGGKGGAQGGREGGGSDGGVGGGVDDALANLPLDAWSDGVEAALPLHAAADSRAAAATNLVRKISVAFLAEYLPPLVERPRGAFAPLRASLRLALRVTLAMVAATAGAVLAHVAGACGDAETTVCAAAAAGPAWVLPCLQSIAHHGLWRCSRHRHEMGDERDEVTGDAGSVLHGQGQCAIFDVTGATGFWAPIEEVEVEECGPDSDSEGSGAPVPPLSIAERLVAEYGRLAPGGQHAQGRAGQDRSTSWRARARAAPAAVRPLSAAPAAPAPAAPSRAVPAPAAPAPKFPPPQVADATGAIGEPTVLTFFRPPPLAVTHPRERQLSSVSLAGSNSSIPSQVSERSAVTGPTGTLSGSSQSYGRRPCSPSVYSGLSGSTISLGGEVHLNERCDLDGLKQRYIESILSRPETKGDQRLDQADLAHMAAALDASMRGRWLVALSLAALAAALGLTAFLGLALSGRSVTWPHVFVEVVVGFSVAMALEALCVAAAALVPLATLSKTGARSGL